LFNAKDPVEHNAPTSEDPGSEAMNDAALVFAAEFEACAEWIAGEILKALY
jgi:hypothetical protein